jgi:hypothetical protein
LGRANKLPPSIEEAPAGTCWCRLPDPHDFRAVRAARGAVRIARGDEQDIGLTGGLLLYSPRI